MEISTLPISGFRDETVPNKFYMQPNPAGIALILPGLRYTCDMPLLYFLTQTLLDRHFDVIQLHTDYTVETLQTLTPAEQLNRITADAQAAIEVAYQNCPGKNMIVAGKSIGTLPIAMLMSTGVIPQAACIWLTPLCKYPFVVDAALHYAGPAMLIASQGDETFDEEGIAQIQHQTQIEVLVFDKANHSLLIPGETLQSLGILEKVVEAYGTFLDRLCI
jgi:hypothetical protein